jgi:hypothetical protein
MATLKEVAATQQIVTEEGLGRALTELKTYIDGKDTAIGQRIDALLGTTDATKIIDTFKEIKDFLSDYDSDDTLKSLLDAVSSSVAAEQSRATAAAESLGGRVTTLENVAVMTSAQAKTLFDGVFNA